MNRSIRSVLLALAGVIVGAIVVLSIPAPGEQPTQDDGDPPITTVGARTLLAWTPVELPDHFAGTVERIEGVSNVAEVRSATLWLDAWRDEQGRPSRPPAEMRIPIEVAAIDVPGYHSFVPQADRTLLAELEAANGIVLGHRGAALRGIRANGALTFGEVQLDVIGVINDSLIGAHEAVVSLQRAEALGITRPRYLLVEVDRSENHEVVADRIRDATSEQVRVRAPGETPEFRHGDAVLPVVRMKELFGEFAGTPSANGNLIVDDAWKDANIITGDVPVLGSMTCHRELFASLRAAMEEIERRGLSDQISRGDFGGCFSPRFLSQDEDAGISHHSWGAAFDINVGENPFGAKPALDRRVVEILERWGFAWGGRWLVPDGMHFEYLKPPLSPKG